MEVLERFRWVGCVCEGVCGEERSVESVWRSRVVAVRNWRVFVSVDLDLDWVAGFSLSGKGGASGSCSRKGEEFGVILGLSF